MALSRKEFYTQVWQPGRSFVEYAPNWNKNPNPVIAPSYEQFENNQVQVSKNGMYITGTITASRADAMKRDFDNAYNDYIRDEDKKASEESLAQITSRENTFNTLADQIRGLTAGGRMTQGAAFNAAIQNLGAGRNYGTSDIGTRLNFQVSDQQIIDDFNTSKLARLNRVVEDGNTQITGIGERLATANTLLSSLPSGDPRRTSSEAYIKELQGDLKSVQEAVASAQKQVTDFKPLTAIEADGLKEITAFREFARLPEERASDQLRQIDPESYQTAIGLGQRYRQMATEALPETTDPRTEQLRGAIEDEALNQLRLGSTLDQEVRRNVEQGVRAAQTARGNIFGVGPAVEEAMETGLAGEQRKLARYGAAAQFLGSGMTRGDALRDNIAFRDTLLQNRLGQASNFIAGGPSIGNLAQARTTQQQNAFANYINANQANPGQFNPQTFNQPFYQTTDPQIPVALTQTAASIYNSMQSAQASMYGSQVGAIANSYQSPASAFGAVAQGLGNLFSFKI